jgi:hypothetical protein
LTSSTYVCDELGKWTVYAVKFKPLSWDCSEVCIKWLSSCGEVANKVHEFIEQSKLEDGQGIPARAASPPGRQHLQDLEPKRIIALGNFSSIFPLFSAC